MLWRVEELHKKSFNSNTETDELKKFAELKDQGIITEEEFNAKKKRNLRFINETLTTCTTKSK